MTYPITALDATRYNALRGNGSPRTYKASQFLCTLSNTIVLAAQVNGTIRTAVYASIDYDTVSEGSYTNIQPNMLVLISRTNDPRDAYFIGRARLAQDGNVATSTVLNINETSNVIGNNHYIFVIHDFRPFHELGRVSGGVYKKDYSLTFTQLKPIISGLQSAYAGIVSGSPSGYTVSFAASAIAATSGATISSYAYTLPASGATVTAGATNTANVTVRFDASATEYWVMLVVTDSGGRTQTRYIPVWAVPADLSTTVVRGFMGAQIEGSLDNGWSATVEAFAGVSSLLDGTLCCIFDVEYYQETQYSLFNTVKFVGRFRSESNETTADEVYSTKRKVTFEIEGTASQLARISSPAITARDAASPTVWDEIKTLTIWRAIAYLLEHSTFHQCFSLSFDNTDNTYRAFQLQMATGALFDSVKDLAQAINGVFEFAPTGEARIVRDARYIEAAARLSLVTIADFTASDWINFNLSRDYFDTVGLVEGSGGTYAPSGSGIAGTSVMPLLSIAPGVAQGNGDGTSPLPRQILIADTTRQLAQAEINQRTANHFAASNPTPTISVDMRGAYNWLIPSANQWYTFDITTDDNRRGLEYSSADRWQLKSLSVDHDNIRGNKTVSAQFALETSGELEGVVGQTIVIPPQNNTPPTVPEIPPIVVNPNTPPPPDVTLPPDPAGGDVPPITLPDPFGVPLDGNAVAYFSAFRLWVTRTFITTPLWIEITPPDMEGIIKDAVSALYGIYLLTNDGVNSWLYYVENAFGTGLTWTVSDPLDGIYSQIVTTSKAGELYVIGNQTTAGNCADDWQIGTGTETDRTDNTITADAQFLGGNWRVTILTNEYPGSNPPSAAASRVLGVSVTGATVGTSSWMQPGDHYPDEAVSGIYLGQCCWLLDMPMSGPGTVVFTLSDDGGLCGDCSTTGNWESLFSTDYGATFAAPDTIAAGGAGADSVKIGASILAGGQAQTRIATTAGGAYSDYGDPLPASFIPAALIVPRYQFGSISTGNINTSTPQYLIASSAVDVDDATLYKVTASGVTFTDVTPIISGDHGLTISPRGVWMPWWSGSIIFAVMMFGSSPRLVKSTNAGVSWTDLGILDDDATMVVGRKGDTTMKQLYITNSNPAYSPDRGTTIISKSYPADSAVEPGLGIFAFG